MAQNASCAGGVTMIAILLWFLHVNKPKWFWWNKTLICFFSRVSNIRQIHPEQRQKDLASRLWTLTSRSRRVVNNSAGADDRISSVSNLGPSAFGERRSNTLQTSNALVFFFLRSITLNTPASWTSSQTKHARISGWRLCVCLTSLVKSFLHIFYVVVVVI